MVTEFKFLGELSFKPQQKHGVVLKMKLKIIQISGFYGFKS